LRLAEHVEIRLRLLDLVLAVGERAVGGERPHLAVELAGLDRDARVIELAFLVAQLLLLRRAFVRLLVGLGLLVLVRAALRGLLRLGGGRRVRGLAGGERGRDQDGKDEGWEDEDWVDGDWARSELLVA